MDMRNFRLGRNPRLGKFTVGTFWFAVILVLNILEKSDGLEVSNRPPRTCKEPRTESCISFDPDPDPPETPALPDDDNDDPKKGGYDTIAKFGDVQFSHDDDTAFFVPRLQLYRYFENADIADAEHLYKFATLKVIEWAGRRTLANPEYPGSSFQEFLESRSYAKSKFIPLHYDGSQTKVLSYLCNPLQGTHLRAIGFKMRPDVLEKSNETYSPFYASLGDNSFHAHYIQPLFVEDSALSKMARDHPDEYCQLNNDGTLPKNSKLNYIHDFSFTIGRLILGMHCGILIVRDIETSRPSFVRAIRNPPADKYNEEQFIKSTYVKLVDSKVYKEIKFEPINIVAASTCCPQEPYCTRQSPIAAAYPLKSLSDTGLKFLYVSTDLGDSFDRKVVATPNSVLHLIRGIYEMGNPESVEPPWVTDEIFRLKNKGIWPENDPAADYILTGATSNKTSYVKDECKDIVSLEVVPEEESIIALCRTSPEKLDMGNGNGNSSGSSNKSVHAVYAVFNLRVSAANPLIPAIRKSRRKLGCQIDPFDLGGGKFMQYEPKIVRALRSFDIFIIGCSSLIYHSVNGGQTFWNPIFYRRHDTGEQRRHPQDKNMKYPIAAFAPDGHSVVFVDGDWYAFGHINYNREFRMIMDRISQTDGKLPDKRRCAEPSPGGGAKYGNCTACFSDINEPPECDVIIPACENYTGAPCNKYWKSVIKFPSYTRFIPYYSNNGQLLFSFVILHILQANQDAEDFQRLYKNRKALRLIDFPVRISSALRPFYRENQGIAERDKYKAFIKCPTFSFSLKPRYIFFDLGDTAKVELQVVDLVQELPLGIFASQNSALQFRVEIAHKGQGTAHELDHHDWDIYVTAVGTRKTAIQRRTDAFFGSEYSIFLPVATFAVFTTYPQMRCHVQPSGQVYIDISCGDKALVVHEGYNRPQCAEFFEADEEKKYRFKYEEGEYDPILMDYWLTHRPKYYRMEGKTVHATYDYETFACPILPYRLQDVTLDLRIVDLDINSNFSLTDLGLPYNLSYVIIEVHGAKGFTYSKTVREAGCVRPPQTLEQMLAEWKLRRENVLKLSKTYKNMRPQFISDMENIWNRVNYRPCQEKRDFEGELTEEQLNAPYEIMQRSTDPEEEENRLVWTKERNRKLFIFAAFEVDARGTFCKFKTYFAITVRGNEESVDWHSIVRFFALFLLFLLIVWLGYYLYRSHLRRIYRKTYISNRLERAAWQILFRYERFLHEIRGEIVAPAAASTGKTGTPAANSTGKVEGKTTKGSNTPKTTGKAKKVSDPRLSKAQAPAGQRSRGSTPKPLKEVKKK